MKLTSTNCSIGLIAGPRQGPSGPCRRFEACFGGRAIFVAAYSGKVRERAPSAFATRHVSVTSVCPKKGRLADSQIFRFARPRDYVRFDDLVAIARR